MLLNAEQNFMSSEHGTNINENQAQNNSADTSTHQQNHNTADIPQSQVFSHIIGTQLGSHKEIGFYEAIKMELPVIILDNGLHFYANTHRMEEAGIFKEVHHKKVRAIDEQPPFLDLSLTSLIVYQWIAIIAILILAKTVISKYKKNPGKAPSGFQNLAEYGVEAVKTKMVYPNIEDKKTADKLLPYFISVYFFILFCNLIGLIPGGHTPTGSISVTAALAVIAFLVIQISSIVKNGIGAWFHHLLGGAPWWLFPIMVPIEIISMFVKPFALMIRLFANMTAGHVVLLSLVGLIFFFKSFLVSPLTIGFSLFTYMLETLVVLLQAFIFTVLTAVFVGLATGGHDHEDHEYA